MVDVSNMCSSRFLMMNYFYVYATTKKKTKKTFQIICPDTRNLHVEFCILLRIYIYSIHLLSVVFF